MRILFLCNSHVWGGAERYVHAVATQMASRGHVVYGAAPPRSPLFHRLSSRNPDRTFSIDIGPKLARGSAGDMVVRWRRYSNAVRDALRTWHREYGIELVHVQFKKEQLLATPAAVDLGMTVVWTEHGPLPPLFRRTPPAMWLYRRAARRTKAIICVADFVARNLVASGIAEGLTSVCYNGVDLSSITAGRERAATRIVVRRALDITERETVIAAIGRLTPIKGVRSLIEAVPGLVRAGLRTQILVVGDGPQRDELESFAARLEVADRVRFLGHRGDVAELLTAIDIVALPSLSEGMPFAAIEAMAAGVPVVATAVGGVPELLDGGRAGRLVAPDSPDDLRKALDSLVRDASQRAALGESGRRRVERLFNHDRMMTRTEQILHDAVAGSEPRAVSARPTEAIQS
jgi:glycosyltransferase involved in cell wall biosynthesis